MNTITKVVEEVLAHIDIYLGQLSDADYGKPLPLLSEASIGGHTRHVLDGFLCLMRQQGHGVISYDLRERDPEIEINTAYTAGKLQEIKRFIHELKSNDSYDFEVNYSNHTYRTTSSLQREVIHNIEHVIHHLAIIKIALLTYHPEIELPMEFGVAPSTLRYWEASVVKTF